MTRVSFHIMGMKCFKCGQPLSGGLLLPEPITVNEFGEGLTKLGIMAVCNDCIERNPFQLNADEVDKAV